MASTRVSRPTRSMAGVARGRRMPLGKQGAVLVNYFREVRSELRKVVWPTRQEATNLTMVTIGLSALFGLFLGGVDFTFQEFFRFMLRALGGGG